MRINNPGPSAQALSKITDAGLFERLATAILREANPLYASLAHLGVNADGQTIKAPLDGICFVKGAQPPHLIALHHTICAASDLDNKWLHDPSTVVHHKKGPPKKAFPEGDFLKTAAIVEEERKRNPDLKATLILTTNEEPSEELVRNINSKGHAEKIEIDIWSRSSLAHYLDNTPSGQWLRREYLGIDQERLSPELFRELSKKSLQVHQLPDDQEAWVQCGLDLHLDSISKDITFLVARSGSGKSVACRKWLSSHIEAGGVGLVISHDVIASSVTLEQAVDNALRQLHPSLASTGHDVASCCAPERPLLLVVEDINKSGQSQPLIERISRWSRKSDQEGKEENVSYKMVCPIWPQALASMGDQIRKQLEPLVVFAESFSPIEGRQAVQRRAELVGKSLSEVEADSISSRLGHDPLLIALHDQSKPPDANGVLEQFVLSSLDRTSSLHTEYTAADYLMALRLLASEMLLNKQLEPSWKESSQWFEGKEKSILPLSHLVHAGELLHRTGVATDQRIGFRHDRVREWLLIDAAAQLEREGNLSDLVLAEPFFAEVIGGVLIQPGIGSDFVDRVRAANPLALFHAFRTFGDETLPQSQSILDAIDSWIKDPSSLTDANRWMRREALAALAETTSSKVVAIANGLNERIWTSQAARLRNGDVLGGIELCRDYRPGLGAPFRDRQIEHATLRCGPELTQELSQVLQNPHEFTKGMKMGALRLAGYLASSALAAPLEACWHLDKEERIDYLDDYLWAFAHCCGDAPEKYLGPVFDEWASLPLEGEKGVSPRVHLAAGELRWAFQKKIPINALDYFIIRAQSEELRWPITLMLHSIDHITAVKFIVEELANRAREFEGKEGIHWRFPSQVADEWRRAQEYGRPMSVSSRELLLKLWQDESGDKHLRLEAFALWAATTMAEDVDILRAKKSYVELDDKVLWARLQRGDTDAIPALVEKLTHDDNENWIVLGRYIWSPELTIALDELLERRKQQAKPEWGYSYKSDWITYEMIMRLPVGLGEAMLLKHWEHLRFSASFVQAALYLATPMLIEKVEKVVAECPAPVKLFEYLASHYGVKTQGRKGITSEAQMMALVPYLGYIDPIIGMYDLWSECNAHGWFELRRQYLDSRMTNALWEPVRAYQTLTEMLTDQGQRYFLDRWIDDYLSAGTSWVEIRDTLQGWLNGQRSVDALSLVASAIIHGGSRSDLQILQVFDGMHKDQAESLIRNANYAVRRRSLH